MKNIIFAASSLVLLSSCSVFEWVGEKSNQLGSHLPVSSSAERCTGNMICSSNSRPANNTTETPAQARGYQPQPQGLPSPSSQYPGQAPNSPVGNPQIPGQIGAQGAYNPNSQPGMAPAYYGGQQMMPSMGQAPQAMPNPYAPNPYAGSSYPGQQMPAQYGMPPQAMPMPPQAMQKPGTVPVDYGSFATPMGAQSSQVLNAEQSAALAANPNMSPDAFMAMQGMPQNPYDEAAADPRLKPYEATPEWKKDNPEVVVPSPTGVMYRPY